MAQNQDCKHPNAINNSVPKVGDGSQKKIVGCAERIADSVMVCCGARTLGQHCTAAVAVREPGSEPTFYSKWFKAVTPLSTVISTTT